MADKDKVTIDVTEFITGEIVNISKMGIGISQKTLDNLKQKDFKYRDKNLFTKDIMIKNGVTIPKQIDIFEDKELGRTLFNSILNEYETLAGTQKKGNKQTYTIQSPDLKKKPKIDKIIKIGSVLTKWSGGDPPISELYELSSEITERYTEKTELFDGIPTKLFDAINNFIDVLITFNKDLSDKIKAQVEKWTGFYRLLLKKLPIIIKEIDSQLEIKKIRKYEKYISIIWTNYVMNIATNKENIKKIKKWLSTKNNNDLKTNSLSEEEKEEFLKMNPRDIFNKLKDEDVYIYMLTGIGKIENDDDNKYRFILFKCLITENLLDFKKLFDKFVLKMKHDFITYLKKDRKLIKELNKNHDYKKIIDETNYAIYTQYTF